MNKCILRAQLRVAQAVMGKHITVRGDVWTSLAFSFKR